MSRTSRHVSAIDIPQRERAFETVNQTYRENHPPASVCQRRANASLLQRLRSGSTQALITGGCANMRDLCSSIQGITAEINNLLTSIENFLPLINSYLNTAPARETISITPEAPSNPAAKTQPETVVNQQSALPKQPRPEDIQQLLENPLVKNLLSSFVQNAAGKN